MSDWSLGKKLNSQIAGVPLNHLIWLNDYKTFGEDSYVFQNKDVLHELYKSYNITAPDRSIRMEAFSFLFDTEDKDLGLFISNISEVKNTGNSIDWASVRTREQLFSDDVFSVIKSSEKNEIRTYLIGKYVERLGSNQELMAQTCASSKKLKLLYDLYTETDMSPFLNSSYLHDSVNNSPLYEIVSYTGGIKPAYDTGYDAYNGPCFVVSASQAYTTYSIGGVSSIVYTLSGKKSVLPSVSYGSDGSKMSIYDFADTAKMHPYYEPGVSEDRIDNGTFYMAILKCEQ